MTLYKQVGFEPCDCCNATHEVAMMDDIKVYMALKGFAVVPLQPTKLRIASIGMTIQGTMDRMELTYDDISAAVYRVAVEPEVVIAAQGE